MPVGRHSVLAPEGRWYIAVAAIAAAAVYYYVGLSWSLPLWATVLLLLHIFRDPRRIIPSAPQGVVCPADGWVTAVEEAQDPYLKRPARCISVSTGLFDVHSHRSPVEGKIMEAWYHQGTDPADTRTNPHRNYRSAHWIQTDEGEDVVIVQVAGRLARRILCYKQPGERIGQGERYGYIRFGSQAQVYVSVDARVIAAAGDKVSAGSDVIAMLAR